MQNTTEKWCGHCDVAHPFTPEFFYRDPSKASGLGKCRQHGRFLATQKRTADPEKTKAINRNSYANTRERRVQEKRDERAADPEKARAISRRSWTKNKAKRNAEQTAYRKAHPEKVNAQNRAYRVRKPAVVRAIDQRQRARRRGNGSSLPAVTAADIERKYRVQGGLCHWCYKPYGDNHQVDHVIPLSRGGENTDANTVVACQNCNRNKWARMPWEFNGRLI